MLEKPYGRRFNIGMVVPLHMKRPKLLHLIHVIY